MSSKLFSRTNETSRFVYNFRSYTTTAVLDYFTGNFVAFFTDSFFPKFTKKSGMIRTSVEILAQVGISLYLFESIRFHFSDEDLTIFSSSIVEQPKLRAKILLLYASIIPKIRNFIEEFKRHEVEEEMVPPQQNDIEFADKTDAQVIMNECSSVPDNNF